MTTEGNSEGEIRSWNQAKIDSEKLIKKHGNHPLVQLAKSAIPGVGLVEGLSGEDFSWFGHFQVGFGESAPSRS